MLFNSLSFAVFLPLVFVLYWLIGGCGHAGRVTLPRHPFHLWHPFHLQNLFIVAASYVLDVARGTVKPTKDLVAFLAYVSFFPLLVAGPIERATNLLPQFLKARRFDYDGAIRFSHELKRRLR